MNYYDNSISIAYVMLNEDILLEDRIQYLKDNTPVISTSHDPEAEVKDKNSIIDKLIGADPTRNKSYAQHIVNMYKNKTLKQGELPELTSALSDFEKVKSKTTQAERDVKVKSHPDVQSFKDIVSKYPEALIPKAKANKSLEQDGHKLAYSDDRFDVYHLTDHKASKDIYGGGYNKDKPSLASNWCTASRDSSGNDQWKNYADKGTLHVYHDKKTKKIYQLYNASTKKGDSSMSEQFTDQKNDIVNPSSTEFADMRPALTKIWRKNPDLISGDAKA